LLEKRTKSSALQWKSAFQSEAIIYSPTYGFGCSQSCSGCVGGHDHSGTCLWAWHCCRRCPKAMNCVTSQTTKPPCFMWSPRVGCGPLRNSPKASSSGACTLRLPCNGAYAAWLRMSRNLSLRCSVCIPGGVADRFAAQRPNPPAMGYYEFASRQSGRYRVTSMLSNEQVSWVSRARCHKTFCLKHRLQTAEGLSAEAAGEESLMACLEPWVLLLEVARTTVRSREQPEKGNANFSQDELASVTVALSCERSAFCAGNGARQATAR